MIKHLISIFACNLLIVCVHAQSSPPDAWHIVADKIDPNNYWLQESKFSFCLCHILNVNRTKSHILAHFNCLFVQLQFYFFQNFSIARYRGKFFRKCLYLAIYLLVADV